MDYDLVIAGAGPAGLSLARALSGQGLRIALVDPQPLAALAEPAFDGREIALTRHSAQTLSALGLWQRLPAQAISPLRDARVLDGASPFALVIGHRLTGHGELGWLVANQRIRRAAFEAVQAASAEHGDIRLLAGDAVAQVRSETDAARVRLASGRSLSARLLVAADSRFSATRRAMGIAADQHDFGRSMLVCSMTHETPHHHAAWEWFDHGQTLALLPMNDEPESGAPRASIVLTLPDRALDPLLAMDAPAFGREMTRRFAGRLGAMQLASTRHAYPLVAVWPRRLVGPRFACVGDAAVGMHPVTAHGFNFGLLGVERLAAGVRAAQAAGRDIAAPADLARYECGQQRATRPLYLATQLVAGLYTRETPPARLLRGLALRLAQHCPPFKQAVATTLAG